MKISLFDSIRKPWKAILKLICVLASNFPAHFYKSIVNPSAVWGASVRVLFCCVGNIRLCSLIVHTCTVYTSYIMHGHCSLLTLLQPSYFDQRLQPGGCCNPLDFGLPTRILLWNYSWVYTFVGSRNQMVIVNFFISIARDHDLQGHRMAPQHMSTGHFSWTRPDPAKRWPDPTQPAIADKKPDPTRPAARPFLHMYIFNWIIIY